MQHLSNELPVLCNPKLWSYFCQGRGRGAHARQFCPAKDAVCFRCIILAHSARVLALYDTSARTKISADASAYGLGAVLLQQQTDNPSGFCFMCPELWYTQIEKKALALTWTLEKFSEHVLGKVVCLETDHKPLVPLLGQKSLDLLPPCGLQFRLHLMRFQFHIHHVLGKSLYTADTLSSAPLNEVAEETRDSSTETEQFVQLITAGLPASTDHLEAFSKAQANDGSCSKLIELCKSGWPTRNQLSRQLEKYWRFWGNLTLSNAFLLYQGCIVIPSHMRQQTLEKIHHGHKRCIMHVASSVWWPGVTSAIEQFVQACPTCQKLTNVHRSLCWLRHFQTIHGNRSRQTFWTERLYVFASGWLSLQIRRSAKVNNHNFLQHCDAS